MTRGLFQRVFMAGAPLAHLIEQSPAGELNLQGDRRWVSLGPVSRARGVASGERLASQGVRHRLCALMLVGGHMNEVDRGFDDEPEFEPEPEDEPEFEDEVDDEPEFEDEDEFEDRAGSVEESRDGNELVLSWSRSGANERMEVLRFNRDAKLLRIFPKVRRNLSYEDAFDQLTELQIEAPRWDPEHHSAEGERFGLLHVVGLPRGFAATYEFGLGVMRDYRGLLEEIEERTACTAVRFVTSGEEGPDGNVFRLTLERFEAYRAVVDKNRGRGRTAVGRVLEAERHNAVADLFNLDRVEPQYGRNAVINAITEEVASGYVMNAADRATLVNTVRIEAPKVAHETPEQFGRLREDIELVSLEVLIERFERGLVGRAARDEGHWQAFFATNPFALQQVFAAPILVVRGQVHVRGTGALGRGSRIADFLCVNAVTRSAVVVEIKTPATDLMASAAYRGSGTAEVYPTNRHLSGAVSQVQAQMESVPRDLQDSAELGSIDKWHVRGAVIAGRVSELSDEQRASFLRYREGLTTVTVLGYDEVCERLKSLHAMLTNQPPPSVDV